jgi:hypothetical protein
MEAATPSPPEPTPPLQVARQEDYEISLRPRAALARFPYGTERAILQLHRELEAGRVTAISDEGIWRNGDEAGRERYLIVPVWAWPIYDLKPDSDFWDTGFLTKGFPRLSPSFTLHDGIKFYDVRFHPSGLPVPVPSTDDKSSLPSSEDVIPPKAGRPRKPWWDDLWVEICRQIYEGDLKPERQADIERAMHEWLVTKGETASEMTIRSRARKLFSALTKGG